MTTLPERTQVQVLLPGMFSPAPDVLDYLDGVREIETATNAKARNTTFVLIGILLTVKIWVNIAFSFAGILYEAFRLVHPLQ